MRQKQTARNQSCRSRLRLFCFYNHVRKRKTYVFALSPFLYKQVICLGGLASCEFLQDKYVLQSK